MIKDLEEFEITHTFEEIKQMSKSQFSNILKLKVKQNAFNYLLNKQRSKGKEIKYENIRMAEYLLPSSKLSVSQKQEMFKIRNRMFEIQENFPMKEMKETSCPCGEEETMLHIYNCEILNGKLRSRSNYTGIFTGTVNEQIKIFKRFEESLKERENLKDQLKTKLNSPCDPPVIRYIPSNG